MTFKKKHEEDEASVKHHRKHADEEVAHASEAPADEVLEAPVAPPKMSPPKMLKVKQTKHASWNGQDVVMHAGDEIDPASYGPLGVERFREQGVEFEEV